MVEGMAASLVALTAIALGIGAGILGMYFRFRKQKEEQETIRMAMEKGIELPEDFFKKTQVSGGNGHGCDMRGRGIFYTAVGLALLIALWVVAGKHGAVWALIPLFIGLGCLLNHFLKAR